ncbi:MAG: hypothetical protein RLP14_08285 [Owenweeksia sp.]
MPVLKMLSRRNLSFGHTLDYISRDTAGGRSEPILHNLRSPYTDKKGIVDEFLNNEAYRKVTSGRVWYYHSILSLGEGDREQVTPEMMQAIAHKYLQLRGDIIAVALPHFDTNSPHIHVLESGTRYRENKSSGLRKKELHQLKVELEAFVKEQFPELEHSQVEHGKGKAYLKEPEYQLQKRTGTSERKYLKTLVHEAYTTATSKQDFLDKLLDHRYIHYERTDGVLTGVISPTTNRKYRFKTLGIAPEQIIALETQKERSQEQQLLNQLQHIRQNTNPKNLER